jgi:hypothetical protein
VDLVDLSLYLERRGVFRKCLWVPVGRRSRF